MVSTKTFQMNNVQKNIFFENICNEYMRYKIIMFNKILPSFARNYYIWKQKRRKMFAWNLIYTKKYFMEKYFIGNIFYWNTICSKTFSSYTFFDLVFFYKTKFLRFDVSLVVAKNTKFLLHNKLNLYNCLYNVP